MDIVLKKKCGSVIFLEPGITVKYGTKLIFLIIKPVKPGEAVGRSKKKSRQRQDKNLSSYITFRNARLFLNLFFSVEN
jgi:hypothetical protein